MKSKPRASGNMAATGAVQGANPMRTREVRLPVPVPGITAASSMLIAR
jgi:hypothetical protein